MSDNAKNVRAELDELRESNGKRFPESIGLDEWIQLLKARLDIVTDYLVGVESREREELELKWEKHLAEQLDAVEAQKNELTRQFADSLYLPSS